MFAPNNAVAPIRRKKTRSKRGGQQYKERHKKQIAARVAAREARERDKEGADLMEHEIDGGEQDGDHGEGGEEYGVGIAGDADMIKAPGRFAWDDWKCGTEDCETCNEARFKFCPECGASRTFATAFAGGCMRRIEGGATRVGGEGTMGKAQERFGKYDADAGDVITSSSIGSGMEMQLPFRPAKPAADAIGEAMSSPTGTDANLQLPFRPARRMRQQ